ncbi:hypothetical protein GCM10017709_15450 [Glutamicibacter nicotianae]|uniref:Uncharacterized protein n=1 Tax=Glutamicibacter nicotianae TaxID=37929 RepID=A0ABQ0RII3_GLUNI|nr:hypothetical protein ANI01nite_08290 [Glutamicibacter nicotianae]
MPLPLAVGSLRILRSVFMNGAHGILAFVPGGVASRRISTTNRLARDGFPDRLFPWGTPLDEEGCHAASQVLSAAIL